MDQNNRFNRYTAAHTLDLYSEVASICRPPLALTSSEMGSFKKTQTPSTGYIISVFKVFEGDDGERFEKNWLYWTGARMLYRWLLIISHRMHQPINTLSGFYCLFGVQIKWRIIQIINQLINGIFYVQYLQSIQ